MKKTVIFLIILLILKANIAFAKVEGEFQYKLNQVPITDEMKSFVINTCENEIYTLYQGEDLLNTKGMNFKKTKLNIENARKISDAVIISKLNIYKAIRLNESNFYGIYVKNQGMYFYKDFIIDLLSKGYLNKKNGIAEQIKKENSIKDIEELKEYIKYHIYEDVFVIIAEKTENEFKYINSYFWKDPELGWGNFLMFDEVPYTSLDKLASEEIIKYSEYFREHMLNIARQEDLENESIICIETTYAR